MSRSVRELHLMRYGATTSQLHNGLSHSNEPSSREAIQGMVERLHQTKDAGGRDGRGGPAHGYRSRQQRDSPATCNMPTLFPSYADAASASPAANGRGGANGRTPLGRSVRRGAPSPQQQQTQQAQPTDDAANEYGSGINRPIVRENEVPTYPTDWRRNPTCKHDDDELRWLYMCFTLPLLPTFEAVTQETIAAIDSLMAYHGVPMVKNETRRKDVRDMLRDSRRYGLLMDIISTRRTVMAGTPHAAATAIYRHCEEKYPIYVKFVFVGITDNGTKRVARDVFSGGRVPTYELGNGATPTRNPRRGASPPFLARKGGRAGSSGKPSGSIAISQVPGGGRALPFDVVDSVHCFVAHPKGDEAAILQAKGEQERHERELQRIARRYTPKYVPPPPPEWLQRLLTVQARTRTPDRREQAVAHYNHLSMPTAASSMRRQQLTSTPQAMRGAGVVGSSGDEDDRDEGGIVLESGENQWLFGKAMGGADDASVLAAMGASPTPQQQHLGNTSQVGSYLPTAASEGLATPLGKQGLGDGLGTPHSRARPATPQRATPTAAREYGSANVTREEQYLSMAQRIAERLRKPYSGSATSSK